MQKIRSHTFTRITSSIEKLGMFWLFVIQVFKWSVRKPYRWYLFTEQIEKIGVMSIPIILLSSLSIGMIFSLQLGSFLSMFRAEMLVGAAVAKTLTRELAPVVTSLMLIARIGSAMTAELGTMRSTEQIDAMETMSVNPIQYLVLPRVVASVIVFPFLTGIANIVGAFGSYLISVVIRKVDEAVFLDQLYWYVDPRDIYSGIFKAAVMGFLVSLICCFYGFNAKGGSRGVGDAATRAVVTSSVGILIADYIMADIMIKILFK
jgi:phospholipid/cholesterol/gamma-HCH transport system permease protein